MRIEQTPDIGRSPRLAVDRPATMRDPSRLPIDVVIDNLSETGALLRGEGSLPVGTLISLGIAGVGLRFARVVRTSASGLGIEFMLPIEPAAVARAKTAETLVSVAVPQMPRADTGVAMPLPSADGSLRTPVSGIAGPSVIDPRYAGLAEPPAVAPPGWRPGTIWLIGIALVVALVVLIAG